MKKKRPIDREAGFRRDANLVVIASEDEHAVKQYFAFFQSAKIKFHVLPATDGRSAPEHVLDRIRGYLDEHQIGDGDAFWAVCDCDRWTEPSHVKNMTHLLRECRKMGVAVALSNPCFELWLLLHFAEHPTESPLTCKEVEKRLRAEAGAYNKGRVDDLPLDDERVRAAVSRAEANHDADPLIPTKTQTAVHLIIKSLIEKGIVSIPPMTPVVVTKKRRGSGKRSVDPGA